MQRMTRFVEAIIFNSRWLVAPFLLGLVIGLAALAFKFLIKLADFVMQIPTAPPADVIVGILTLVDLTLIANLIVIVICSSYENFLTHIDPAKHPGLARGADQNRLFGPQAETAWFDRGDCCGQCIRVVHGYRTAC